MCFHFLLIPRPPLVIAAFYPILHITFAIRRCIACLIAMHWLAVCALLLAALRCAAAARTPPAPSKPQPAVGGKASCLYPNQQCQSTTQARGLAARHLCAPLTSNVFSTARVQCCEYLSCLPKTPGTPAVCVGIPPPG